MTWYTAAQVSVANGSAIVAIDSGESIANIQPGDGLIVGSFAPVEIKRTYVGGVGEQLIELSKVWGDSTQSTVPARSFPTAGDFADAVKALKNATAVTADNFKALEAFGTQDDGTVDFKNQDGSTRKVKTLKQMEADHTARVNQVDSLIGSVKAMKKSEFFALANQRKSIAAGSGFSEWGKHPAGSNVVNQGMWMYSHSDLDNGGKLILGRGITNMEGVSVSDSPVVLVNGIELIITNRDLGHAPNIISFPNAPDGLDKADGTGRFADLAAAIASGGLGLTESVISRKDFVILEVWHEKISDKDWFVPYGNTQMITSSSKGIGGLVSNYVAQGYSAFGDFDTLTKGYGKRWSLMTETEKTIAIQDPDNNIYSDDDELVQVRYRIRVIKGLGDDWQCVSAETDIIGMRYGDNVVTNYVKTQGSRTTTDDFINGAYAEGRFVNKDSAALPDNEDFNSKGVFYASSNGTLADDAGHNGLCYALPIALVQRRNSGTYHPSINPYGASYTAENNDPGAISVKRWFESGSYELVNLSECFDPCKFGDEVATGLRAWDNGDPWGNMAAGTSPRPDGRYYDALYPGDISDLRMCSHKLPYAQVRNIYKQEAIRGDVRGFESLPMTHVHALIVTAHTSISGVTRIVGTHTNTAFSGAELAVGDGNHANPATHSKHLNVWLTDGVNSYPAFYYDPAAGNGTGTNYLYIDKPFDAGWDTSNLHVVDCESFKMKSHSGDLVWTDIIGSPENVLMTFPNGVAGQWVPVIPNGNSQTFPYSKKIVNYVSRQIANDASAVNWASHNSIDLIDTIKGTYTYSVPSAAIQLHHYKTKESFTFDSANLEVLDLGGVYASTRGNVNTSGTLLSSSLIGKALTGDSGNRTQKLPLLSVGIDDGNNKLANHTAHGFCEHANINLVGTGPAFKMIDYLAEKSGRFELAIAYKELVFDTDADEGTDFISILPANSTDDVTAGNIYSVAGDVPGVLGGKILKCVKGATASLFDPKWRVDQDGNVMYSTQPDNIYFKVIRADGWGDDNQFQIADNQDALIDDNGNAVKYGTATIPTQFFSWEP